jgi:hypothetical protein
MMRLSEIIEASARAGLRLQGADGAMPAGHNGPWEDPETPVRATAHWALTFYRAYEGSGRQEFLDAAVSACNYLLAPDHRPAGATFVCRLPKPGKTRCNGLIGQAWAAEPLILIGGALGNPEYLRLAEQILAVHPYDWRAHGWQTIEVDGRCLGLDRTYNHQVWFCAMNCMLERAHAAQPNSQSSATADFLNHLGRTTRLTQRSTFAHTYPAPALNVLRNWLGLRSRSSRRASPSFPMSVIETGYHSFSLYGLALLRDRLPLGDHQARDSLGTRIGRGLASAAETLWDVPSDRNPFRYAYNPTGFEVALALATFPGLARIHAPSSPPSEAWAARQVALHFDLATGLMERNSPDPTTLAARVYEATRLPDLEIRTA